MIRLAYNTYMVDPARAATVWISPEARPNPELSMRSTLFGGESGVGRGMSTLITYEKEEEPDEAKKEEERLGPADRRDSEAATELEGRDDGGGDQGEDAADGQGERARDPAKHEGQGRSANCAAAAKPEE